MEIVKKYEDGLVFELTGRLDTITAPELEKKFNEEEIDEDKVILDFAGLDYISSAGLRSLLVIKRNLDSKKKVLEIHNINDVVKEVFSVTGFNNILNIK
jgi:anti-sigma B factor antagonist